MKKTIDTPAICPKCGKPNHLAETEGYTEEAPREYHAECWRTIGEPCVDETWTKTGSTYQSTDGRFSIFRAGLTDREGWILSDKATRDAWQPEYNRSRHCSTLSMAKRAAAAWRRGNFI